MKRLISASILIPLLSLYVLKLPSEYFAALLAVVSAVAMAEFLAMYGSKGALRNVSLLLGSAIVVIAHYSPGLLPEALMASAMLIAMVRLFAKSEPSGALKDIAPAVVGLLYVSLLLSYQLNLRRQGPEWVLFLYGAVWASDGMAYYIGKGLGKRKLYEKMSPKKTVEGAVASVAGGALGAVALSGIFGLDISYGTAALAGASVGTSAIIGDLVESMFKRDAGIKDSGGLIPGGHGGMLDKIDSALFAAPVLYWLLLALGVFYRG